MGAARLAPVWAMALVLGCSEGTGPAADSVLPVLDAAPDVAPDAASATVSLPVTIAAYPGGSGKLLLVALTVNGSAPVQVLLDTGSAGLRVFASALGGTSVTTTSEATTTRFGADILLGHRASGMVDLGNGVPPLSIGFELVESISCDAADPYCDPATAGQPYAAAGIQGVLGVSLRSDPSGIDNLLGRLPSPLSDGFTLRTGGYSASSGELVLGPPALSGMEPIVLQRRGSLPGGLAAWGDDEIQICFAVDKAPTDPPCGAAVFDSGSNLDVLYARNLPASAVTADGLLAPGVTFEASHGAAWTMDFTVGDPVTWSLDGVLVQQDEAFSILGIEVFFRHDVAFDRVGGRIGLRPR